MERNGGFRIEADEDGEIKLPGKVVSPEEMLVPPLTEEQAAEFQRESERIIEATRPTPGQADVRIG